MPEAGPAAHWRPSHSPWLITISVLLATFMEVLDTSIANVALPHIAGNLSSSIDESTWVLTSYLVANAIILPVTGWLSGRFGRKRYLAFSVVLFTVSSALCGMAQNLPQLIIARIFQGLGGGGLQPLAQAILLESFPPEDRGSAMAAYGMGVVVAPIIGPTLGGWITDNYSWRWIFYINIPIGIAGLLMQEAFLEDPPYLKARHPLGIDYIGFGAMAIGIAMLQIVLDKGQEADWFGSVWIRWTLAGAVIALIFFVLWELFRKHPIVNLRILGNRNFAAGTLLIALLGAVLYGTTAILPIFMQSLLNYTAYDSGLAMTPRGIGSFISMLIIGRLVRRVEGRLLIVLGFAGVASTMWILSRLNLEITTANISWPLVLNGLSMGFIFVPLTTLSVATLRQDEIYQAMGIYSLLRNLGASVGISSIIALQFRDAQAHQALLVANLTPYNPEFMRYLHAIAMSLKGIPVSRTMEMAAGMAYGVLVRQAVLLSFMDTFRWLVVICVCCAPLVLLFKKGRPYQPAPAAIE